MAPAFACFSRVTRNPDSAQLHAFAKSIVGLGCAAASVWGPASSEFEDAIDLAHVLDVLERNAELGEQGVLMTTSHPAEPLQDALDFYIDLMSVDQDYATEPHTWVIVSVGSRATYDTILDYMRIRFAGEPRSQAHD